MKKMLSLKSVLAGLGCVGALNAWGLTVPAHVPAAFGNLPLYFEANQGQAGHAALFVARGNGCQFSISPAGAQFDLQKTDAGTKKTSGRTVQMQFVGAGSQAQVQGIDELSGKINYLVGDNPAQWHTGVATFARVRIEQLYHGVNLVYYGNQRQLEYDFTVAPGANPDAVKIRFAGADKISIGAQGELILTLGHGEIIQPRPVIYQTVDGARQTVSGGYRLVDAHTVKFALGRFDHGLPLVIDPVLSYSTYFGGNSSDEAWKVAVDTNGFVYFAGETLSAQLPTTNAFQPNYAGGSFTGDAFVAKFSPNGTNLVYCTYLGGSQDDFAYSLAVDNAGDVFLTGATISPDFPTTNALYPKILGHAYYNPRNHVTYYNSDAFVAELGPTGSNLIYSTYLGGSGFVGNAVTPGTGDEGLSIAVDSTGNAYVTGYTSSTNFPVINPLVWQTNTFNHLAGSDNAFLTKIGPGGSPLVYSTYFGGTNIDMAEGVAVDSAGAAYLAGYTDSPNFPTNNPVQPNLGGTTNPVTVYNAFVAKFAPFTTNLSLVYSTFLGGTNGDYGYGVAADTNGNAYVIGGTASPNFPDTATNVPGLFNGLYYNTNGLPVTTNAFLVKLDPTGSNIIYAAVFGGTNAGVDIGYGVALDPSGDVFVVGASSTTNFPAVNTPGLLGTTNAGGSDVFVIAFNTNCSAILYSGYFGGSGNDFGYGIAVDSQTNAYIVGQTASANFPTFYPFQSSLNGPSDAFLAKIGWVVLPPQITTQPTNQTVAVGTGVTLVAAATGSPPLVYQWQVQGTNLTWTNLVSGGNISGATNATLIISNAQTTNNGNYQLIVTNYAGSVTSSVVALTVTNIPTSLNPLSGQTVAVGSNVTFTVTGTGGTPPLYFQWQKNGINLTNGTTISGSIIIGATNNPLLIFNAQTNDDGNYWFIVTNPAGSVTSSVAVLTVTETPLITTQPTNQTVGLGSAVTFVVTAAGAAPLSYQWQFGGANLTNGLAPDGSIIGGATTPTLSLNNAQTSNNGGYSVVVTNSFGSVTSSPPAVLTVLTAPAFTTIMPAGTTGGFVLSGVGGTNNATFIVLTSTNLATPLAQWTSINAFQFGSQGQFVFTNTPPTNTPQQFYLLQSPSQ